MNITRCSINDFEVKFQHVFATRKRFSYTVLKIVLKPRECAFFHSFEYPVYGRKFKVRNIGELKIHRRTNRNYCFIHKTPFPNRPKISPWATKRNRLSSLRPEGIGIIDFTHMSIRINIFFFFVQND